MRRRALLFLTASLLVHGAVGGGGVWLARRAAKSESRDTKPVFAGETFDIQQAVEDHPVASPSVVAPETPLNEHATAPTPSPRLARNGERTGATSVPETLTYGALGDRTATSIVVALARGFPQAASTDPVWRDVGFGDAGSAVLEVDLEADGTLARWSLGPGASPALRQAMVRTMAFVGGRPFVAQGAVTKLRLTARVTADAVRDGADAVYAIHSEHDGGRGSAYFSLSSGRRIDLVIAPVTSE